MTGCHISFFGPQAAKSVTLVLGTKVEVWPLVWGWPPVRDWPSVRDWRQEFVQSLSCKALQRTKSGAQAGSARAFLSQCHRSGRGGQEQLETFHMLRSDRQLLRKLKGPIRPMQPIVLIFTGLVKDLSVYGPEGSSARTLPTKLRNTRIPTG